MFCCGKMKRRDLIKITGNIVNMLFYANADSFGKINNNPGLQNTDSTVARLVFIIVYPVIIAVKSKAYKFIEMKHFFNFCFQPAAKIIISEKRGIWAIAGIVTCQRHCSKVQGRIYFRMFPQGNFRNKSGPESYGTKLKIVLFQ